MINKLCNGKDLLGLTLGVGRLHGLREEKMRESSDMIMKLCNGKELLLTLGVGRVHGLREEEGSIRHEN